jgi:O-antigen/teichoic acid export membrane protein
MWPILALNAGYLALQVAGALVVAARDGSVVDLVAVVVIADAVQLAATWGIWRRLKNKRHPQPLPMHGEGSTERFIYQGKGHLPLRQLLQQAWPFATAGVLATLHIRLIVLILQANASAEVVGWYTAASRTVEAARMLPQALFGALFPALAALAIDPPRMRRTLRQAASILTGYGLLIGLLSLASAKPLIRLLFGSGFDEAAGALIILAWALLPGTLRGLLTLWFYAHHREWTANRLTGFALVLQIGLGLALVERYGLAGAAWTVVIAETFLAGLLFGAACWGGAKISFRRRKPG